MFDDLAELVGIGSGTRVVEVGPGTGQATAGLVALGPHVVGVEMGAGLAAVLQRKFASASVRVVARAFEDWSLPPSIIGRTAGAGPPRRRHVRAAAHGGSWVHSAGGLRQAEDRQPRQSRRKMHLRAVPGPPGNAARSGASSMQRDDSAVGLADNPIGRRRSR